MAFEWLPRIECPIPYQAHPERTRVREETAAWIVEHDLAQGAKGLKRYLSYQLDNAAVCALPHADFGLLRVVGDFIAWLVLSDDYYDEMAFGRDVRGLEGVFGAFRGVVETNTVPEGADSLLGALACLTGRARRLGGEEFYRRFSASIADYWESCLAESRFRAEDRVPTLAEFVPVRTRSVGMFPLYDFIVLERELPVVILDHPYVVAMRHSASRIIAHLNDLFSYYKESAHGDFSNLLITLTHHEGLSLAAATEVAVRMHNEEMASFLRLTAPYAVRAGVGAEDAGYVMQYGDALREWVKGLYEWESNSGRYRHVDNAAVVRSAPLSPDHYGMI